MVHLSLYELNILIRNVLLTSLEPSYWVVAEIAELRVHQNGHCFLELVEKEGQQIRAKTKATIWSNQYYIISQRFANATGQHLKPGMKILFNATIQYHEVYGISLIIRDIDAQYTIGERAKKRQEVIEHLKSDGVFDMNRELSMPLVPQRIAVISSESAAGYGDFLNQLNQNEYGYRLKTTLFPSLMQGDNAENSIIASLQRIFSNIVDFDAVAIIRGGGATLDLDCFDSYSLANHISQFPIPIITGIGHERDETIVDMVAHTKLKTPTAVAVFLIETMKDFEIRIEEHFSAIEVAINEAIDETTVLLDQYSNRIFRRGQSILNAGQLKLSGLTNLMISGYRNVIKMQDGELDKIAILLKRQPLKIVESHSKTLLYLERHLHSIDPESILQRGFSLTTINGKNVNFLSEIPNESEVRTITQNHVLTSKVISSTKRKK